MTILGALFDLDGVLIDSERLYTEFYRQLGLDYHIPDDNFAMNIKGSTIEKILLTYFPSPEASADVLTRINKFEAEMDYPVCEGVIDFLAELRDRGIRTAIVTSSSHDKVTKLWRLHPELQDYFDAVVTGSDVHRSKPDPQGYQMAAERIGCVPEDCWVFEDSEAGLDAGMASGAVVIGLATTLPAERIKNKAHVVIDTFAGFTVDKMLEAGFKSRSNKP